MVKMLTILVSTISNYDLFLLKNMSSLHFFSKNISVYTIFNDQSFNDTLANDIISFEQLGPGLHIEDCMSYPLPFAPELLCDRPFRVAVVGTLVESNCAEGMAALVTVGRNCRPLIFGCRLASTLSCTCFHTACVQ